MCSSDLVTPLTRWRRFDDSRQQLMKAQLQQLIDRGSQAVSKDLYEIVTKSL